MDTDGMFIHISHLKKKNIYIHICHFNTFPICFLHAKGFWLPVSGGPLRNRCLHQAQFRCITILHVVSCHVISCCIFSFHHFISQHIIPVILSISCLVKVFCLTWASKHAWIGFRSRPWVVFLGQESAWIIMNQPADAPGRCLLGSLGQRSNAAGRAEDTKSQSTIVISEWERRTEDLQRDLHLKATQLTWASHLLGMAGVEPAGTLLDMFWWYNCWHFWNNSIDLPSGQQFSIIAPEHDSIHRLG